MFYILLEMFVILLPTYYKYHNEHWSLIKVQRSMNLVLNLYTHTYHKPSAYIEDWFIHNHSLNIDKKKTDMKNCLKINVNLNLLNFNLVFFFLFSKFPVSYIHVRTTLKVINKRSKNCICTWFHDDHVIINL